ncbi:MAG: Sua5/YciO/YrdC/YwlC family protein [Candidatus Woesearchaeota archaeon]
MQVYTNDEFKVKQEYLLHHLKQGAIIIHPTDAIYSIGCNALWPDAVQKIRAMKPQHQHPFCLIAPSLAWIKQHCIIEDEQHLHHVQQNKALHVTLKNKDMFCPALHLGHEHIIVHMPNHWFSKVISELDVPFIMTSANREGEDYLVHLDEVSKELKQHIDFAIDEGIKVGKYTHLVDVRQL